MSTSSEEREFFAALRRQGRDARQAIDAFLASIFTGDFSALADSIVAIDMI